MATETDSKPQRDRCVICGRPLERSLGADWCIDCDRMVAMVNEMAPEIIALARQLCAFVDTIPVSEQNGWCRTSLAEAHRAHVIVNNLRPLILKYEAAMAAAAGSFTRPEVSEAAQFTFDVPPNAPGHEEH